MNANQIGIRISTNGGSLEQIFDNTLGNVKSLAGTEFQKPFVKSICVFDNDGVARLYLKKTANGVVREER